MHTDVPANPPSQGHGPGASMRGCDDGALTGLAGRLPPIACAIDETYVLPLCVVMESLAAAHGKEIGEIRLIVLHQRLGERSISRICHHAQRLGLAVDVRKVPKSHRRLPTFGRFTEAVYVRLEMGAVLIDEPAALYLDADVLVLDDLRPLLRPDLAGAVLAAVRDPLEPVLGHSIALPGWEQLGLLAEREYFNSGVMFLDLDECRRRDIFSRAYDFLIRHPGNVVFPDQDALNWSADDAWMRLERRWNTFALSPLADQPGFRHHAEPVIPLDVLLRDESHAAILHFIGPNKPWTAGYPASRLAHLYCTYLERVTHEDLNGDVQ